MRPSRGSAFCFSEFSWLRSLAAAALALSLPGCTLITDVDREKIPQAQTPTFPEIDAGPQPKSAGPGAGSPDASMPAEPVPSAEGDAGVDADAGDAGPDADAG